MSFKPIDIQVNISQINHVARAQQQQRLQPLLDQAAHAAHLRKEGDEKQHIVEPKGHAENDDSTVKWQKNREKGNRRPGERNRDRNRPTGNEPSAHSRMVLRESDSPEKGGYIDTRR